MLIYESAAGRVAVITDGAGGIGEAIALHLAEHGFRVIIAANDLAAATDAASRIASWGWSTDAVEMRVTDPASIEAAFAWVEHRYRRCDVLVKIAEPAHGCAFVDFPLETWQQAISLNVTGAMVCAQHAARLMIRPKWGRIINIVPTAEPGSAEGRAAYAGSKAALIGLTRQLAAELAPHGITVNAIAPGPVERSASHTESTKTSRSRQVPNVPMGRLARPQEIASAVAFLTSEEAGFLTGHEVPVDGGLVAAGLAQA